MLPCEHTADEALRPEEEEEMSTAPSQNTYFRGAGRYEFKPRSTITSSLPSPTVIDDYVNNTLASSEDMHKASNTNVDQAKREVTPVKA
ncbi:uncharacterized protein ARMOST_07645 [Armillaria ostoyae]|uniref:Uncharacterized protein n=1 Tax=Armillaria ostoyae TaxID=47428 RepID=A0A284R6F6_ARMOS|nr:uncharacterized protein ARMOST_07645 [Armillaria ostoyae]